MLTKSNRTLAELVNLSRRDGKLVLAKGERIIGIILAPALIIFFSHVREGLVGTIGNGFVDIAVGTLLEEMYLSFILFSALAFIWCLCQPRRIERPLELSARKLVLVLPIIIDAPYVILIAAALFNLLHH